MGAVGLLRPLCFDAETDVVSPEHAAWRAVAHAWANDLAERLMRGYEGGSIDTEDDALWRTTERATEAVWMDLPHHGRELAQYVRTGAGGRHMVRAIDGELTRLEAAEDHPIAVPQNDRLALARHVALLCGASARVAHDSYRTDVFRAVWRLTLQTFVGLLMARHCPTPKGADDPPPALRPLGDGAIARILHAAVPRWMIGTALRARSDLYEHHTPIWGTQTAEHAGDAEPMWDLLGTALTAFLDTLKGPRPSAAALRWQTVEIDMLTWIVAVHADAVSDAARTSARTQHAAPLAAAWRRFPMDLAARLLEVLPAPAQDITDPVPADPVPRLHWALQRGAGAVASWELAQACITAPDPGTEWASSPLSRRRM